MSASFLSPRGPTSARFLLGSLVMAALVVLGGASLQAETDDDGFKSIFNGTDLTGWDGDPAFWSVKDGAITGECSPNNLPKHNTFCIWRGGEVDDFEMKAKFKLVGGNSGIQIRSEEREDWIMAGYQADMDEGNDYTGGNYEERGRGQIARCGDRTLIDANGKNTVVGKVGDRAAIIASFHHHDWNDYDIIAIGNHITLKINGVVTCENTDEQLDRRALSGLVGLQMHVGFDHFVVQFKDFRLKRLKLSDDRKKIVVIAGNPSHGLGEHEFEAGVWGLRKCLDKVPGVVAAHYFHGWPENDPTGLDNADAIIFYADGGGGHPALQGDHLQKISALVSKGVGFGCMHYAVEVPADHGGKEWLDWIGGFYESGKSANPVWTATYDHLPVHAVTQGVLPFTTTDEWYFNIHFRPDFSLDTAPNSPGKVIPILTAKPSDATRRGPYSGSGPYQWVADASGRTECTMWVVENPDGQRGYGFTGGHYHKNWEDPNQRKLILNAMLWIAHAPVPAQGVVSNPSDEELNCRLRTRIAMSANGKGGGFNPKKAAFASDIVRKGMIDIDANIADAKELYLVVGDAGDGFACDWADWIDPVLVGADGKETKLVDLAWTHAASGYKEALIGKNVGGGDMKVDGQLITGTGIGVHSQSVIIYNIDGKGFTRFKAKGGVDNGGTDQNHGKTTSVQFMVFIRK